MFVYYLINQIVIRQGCKKEKQNYFELALDRKEGLVRYVDRICRCMGSSSMH